MPGTVVPPVSVRILLFATYAETLGFDSIELNMEHPATVKSVLERLRAFPGGEQLPARPLCAINLSHVRAEAPLSSGDELAILPPLAGG
ncbi:MAG TPA: MoaD/ThiS family protein [Gemmatimonadales bacterium]|nr:MoaD/ThiS family protein [Gemmatimonadales bacterium]